jgi:predicted TIM-barrel fold metal-dependent hydrolase
MFPRAQFHAALKRIMFGSDQMYWPDLVGESIKAIETAPFLGAADQRDILYNNAARFLRLRDAQIAMDHEP